VAEARLVARPSLTGVLPRMDDMELTARTRTEDDQPRVTVRVTALGEKVVEAVGPLLIAQYRHVEKAFRPELIAEVFGVMDRFVGTAAEHGPVRQVALPDPATLDADLARLRK